MTVGPPVLEDEREPEDGHVTDVQHRRPGHHHLAVDPLHLPGGEVVVRIGQVAAGDLARLGVDAAGARVLRHAAAEEPLGAPLVKIREGAVDDAPLRIWCSTGSPARPGCCRR